MRYVVLLALLSGCVEGSTENSPPHIASGAMVKDIPVAINRQIDLLFVIDNSSAMVQYADNLRTNLRLFGNILRSLEGGVPEIRIGVVTTDLGGEGCTTNDDGKLRTATGINGSFIVELVGNNGLRLKNYDGDLGDAIVRLANVGTSGCAQVQPLAAARRALENPANRDFLRKDAFTGIVMITANDAPDASIDSYVQFFKTLHADPSKVMVSGVLGFDDANGRIPKFLDSFPNRSTRARLGDADWSSAFALFSQLIKTTLGSPCIEGPLVDVDPVTPGKQYECAVWYDFPDGGLVVPQCGTALAGPCWKIEQNLVQCPQSVSFQTEGLFKIEQALTDLPSDTHILIECLSR